MQSFAFSSFDALATADVFILTAILNIVPKKDCIQSSDWSDLTQGSSDAPMKYRKANQAGFLFRGLWA